MLSKILYIFFLISALVAQPTMSIITTQETVAQVTTLAGSGTAGDVNGTGTSARFNSPWGIAVDNEGNLYIGGNYSPVIKKVTPSGVVTTFAGSGQPGFLNGNVSSATFRYPNGIAVDGSGNVYVADTFNHSIRKITPLGVVSTLAGSGSQGADDGIGTAASFNNPYGITVDENGILYVTDTKNHQIRKITANGVVTTFAGSGYLSPGSSDGNGTAASFYEPWGIAIDNSGNLYVADRLNHTIRMITPAGDVTTLAGSGNYGYADGTGSDAKFYRPRDVAVDNSGNIYVTDTVNDLIRKIKKLSNANGFTGVVSTVAGTLDVSGSNDGKGTSATFNNPGGIVVASNGILYVTDYSGNRIRKISATVASGDTTNDASLPVIFTSSEPTANFEVGDITVSGGTLSNFSASSSTVYSATFTPSSDGSTTIDVAENTFTDGAGNGNSAASQFIWTYDGTKPTVIIANSKEITAEVTTLAGNGVASIVNGIGTNASFRMPYGLTVDRKGNIYVADFSDHIIRKINPEGLVTTFAGTGERGSSNGTGTSASFYHPSDVAVDGNGNIFVADTYNNRIRKISSEGVVTTFAGRPLCTGCGRGFTDGEGSSAEFFFPRGIALDDDGNIYVADQNNNLIRKITSNGTVSTIAGNISGETGSSDGIGTSAYFNEPYGIAVDNNKNLYVADRKNHMIRKISQAGVVTTLAGSGFQGSADATGSQASFYYPSNVEVDNNGNIYVADQFNKLIRKVTPDGVVTTLAGIRGSSGIKDGKGTSATFNSPTGLAFDGWGYLYVSQANTPMIRKIALTLPSGDTTNDASLPVIFTSSEPTANFEVGDITVSGGTLSNFSASSSTVYSATFTPSSDGSTTIDVAENTFTDGAGNGNSAASQFIWTYDGTKPTVMITASNGINSINNGGITNDSLLTLTFTSSEPTANFEVGDITVSGGTLSNFSASSSTVYSATFTPSSDGSTTIDVAENTFTDGAGNGNSAASQFIWICDRVSPEISLMDPLEFDTSGDIRKQSRWMNKNSRVFYTLSETVASVKMIFTRVGGSIDNNSPHIVSADEFLNIGDNNVGVPVLVDSAVYNIRIEAFDLVGNVGADSISNITYDISAPQIINFSPSANMYMNNTNVSYTLSESVQNGSVSWRECQDANCFGAWPSVEVMNINGENLKVGTHTDVDLKPNLKEGGIYSLQVSFTDSAGNNNDIFVGGESIRGVTYDFTAPTVKSMSPTSNSFLSMFTYSKVKLAFSEPIVDYKLSITSKRGMVNNYNHGPVNDSLIIFLDAPLTSVDTLTVRLDSISDNAGNIGIPIVSSFMTTYLGDFNSDYKIDAQDLSSFVSRWPNVDIGPVEGVLPILTPAMDGITNLRDIGVFTRMWHWSHGTNSPSSKIFASFGEPISIEQSADRVVIPISEHAIAGEIIIEYLKSDIDFNLSNESPENRIILSSKNQASENFIINFGYLQEEKRKELSVDLIQKTNTHPNFSLGYIYYDKNGLVIKSGMQNLKIKAVPLEFALHENYPNPFNPITTFRFDIPEMTDASIIIYNMLGRKIKTFDMSNTPAGYHSMTWDATNDLGTPVSAGVYLYQLQSKDFVMTRKMILLK